jgi:hypothetical protein
LFVLFPPASCAKDAALGPVGLLSAKPAKALTPTNLEGAAVAVGYVQGCGGDFFSYTELAGAVEDVKKVREGPGKHGEEKTSEPNGGEGLGRSIPLCRWGSEDRCSRARRA